MQLRVQFPSRQPPYGSIKYNICESGCQDRGRQREIPDTYGKHAAPLTRSSSVFGDLKKAESGSVQGATVNRRLVEPTNSASVDTIHSNLGIVKKILWLLYAERKENPDTAKADHSAWSGANGGTEFSLIIIYAVSCNSQEYVLLFYALTMLRFRHQTNPLSPFALPAFSSKPDTAEGRPWRRGARDLPSRAGEKRRCRRHPSKAQAPKQSSRTPLRG